MSWHQKHITVSILVVGFGETICATKCRSAGTLTLWKMELGNGAELYKQLGLIYI